MTDTVHCSRCQRLDAAALDAPPYPGELGSEITARVCADCWKDWQQAEVMIINELRLDFMDPRAQEILERQLREFLGLDASAPA